MGSWYNLEGEALAGCISTKCGTMPFPPMGLGVSPQDQIEYRAKKTAWDTCVSTCRGTLTGTSVPYTPRVPSGGSALPPVGTNAGIRPLRPDSIADGGSIKDGGSGISTNMKVGLIVGAAALIGLLIFFRRR